jgi:hypothetical protein
MAGLRPRGIRADLEIFSESHIAVIAQKQIDVLS